MIISGNNGELVAIQIRFVSRACFACDAFLASKFREHISQSQYHFSRAIYFSRAVHFLASKFRKRLSSTYLLREMVLSDRRQLRRRARQRLSITPFDVRDGRTGHCQDYISYPLIQL